MDNLKSDDGGLRELALFAGAGGGILGGKLLGWRTVCAVELEPYARDVLVARQNDGCLEPFPIWDDVRTFDGHPWRGRVDVVSGGFPCQDISAAGKGAGITGERSGLWSHMARIVGEVRPRFVFVENSPLLVSRGLDVVLSDLAALGYDARWGVIGAHHAGAPHKRDRIWIVADAANNGTGWREQQPECGEGAGHVAHASGAGFEGREQPGTLRDEGDGAEAHGSVGECDRLSGPAGNVPDTDGGRGDLFCAGRHPVAPTSEAISDAADAEPERRGDGTGWGERCAGDAVGGGAPGALWWESEPGLGGVADGLAGGVDVHGGATGEAVGRVAVGVPNRSDRLKAIGNGQVPAVAALAWRVLSDEGND